MRHSILREGSVAGVVGATSVAAWFFIVDVVQRHPFQTPIELGRGFFTLFGQATNANTDLLVVIGYTVFHFLAFIAAGIIVAAVVHWAEQQPTVLAGAMLLFVAFEAGFYALTSVFSVVPVFGVLAWYDVAVGNLIAAITMGAYMWRTHPALKAELIYALEGKE
jgi:hypothetical protein